MHNHSKGSASEDNNTGIPFFMGNITLHLTHFNLLSEIIRSFLHCGQTNIVKILEIS